MAMSRTRTIFLTESGYPGAALHASIVGVDDDFPARHDADAGHDAGARHVAVIGLVGSECRQFEEGRAGVEQCLDPVAHEHLALASQPVEIALRPDQPGLLLALLEGCRQRLVMRPVGGELG